MPETGSGKVAIPTDTEKPVNNPKVAQPRSGPAVTLTWVENTASTLIPTL